MNRRRVVSNIGLLPFLTLGRSVRSQSKQKKSFVVFLPGIMGSVLQLEERDLWALSGSAFLDLLKTGGDSIQRIKVDRTKLSSGKIDDGIRAVRLMADLHMIPGFWKIDGYTKFVKSMTADGRLIAGRNFFQFPYDWRLDNRVAARDLADKLPVWLRNFRNDSQDEEVKVSIVAHSMGGLVASYYLEVLEGWRNVDQLITFGTPFRGSMNAVDFVCNGFKKSLGPVGIDLTEAVRSFDSSYQLMATYECIDAGQGRYQRLFDVPSVPNVDRDRARAGYEFHQEIRQAAADNFDRESDYRKKRYEHIPIIGATQPTNLSAALKNSRLEMSQQYKGDNFYGDGTVPGRTLSLPVLPQDVRVSPIYIDSIHGSIQNTDQAILQAASASLPNVDSQGMRSDSSGLLGIGIDSLFYADEPIAFEAVVGDRKGPARIEVKVTNAQGQIVKTRVINATADGRYRTTLPSLPPGVYRLNLLDRKTQSDVTEIITVVSVK